MIKKVNIIFILIMFLFSVLLIFSYNLNNVGRAFTMSIDCNNNDICESGETYENCPNDCEELVLDVLNITETTALIEGDLNTSGNDFSVWLEYSDVDLTNNNFDTSYYLNLENSRSVNFLEDNDNYTENDDYFECNGFIATGNVVKDNRSIFWKVRHQSVVNNKVIFREGDVYNFTEVAGPATGMNEVSLMVGSFYGGNVNMSPENRQFTSQMDGGTAVSMVQYVLGNFNTVEEAAYYIANHDNVTDPDPNREDRFARRIYAVVSAEQGIGAIIDVERVDNDNGGQVYSHITWINNTWASIENVLYCEGGGANITQGQMVNSAAREIINSGDGLFDWKDVIQKMAKSVDKRELGSERFSTRYTPNPSSAVSSFIGVSGDPRFNGSANIGWAHAGRNPIVGIFFPISATYMTDSSHVPAPLREGFETPYVLPKVEYATDGGNLSSYWYYPDRVREIQSYTNYAEDISFVEYDKFMERLNTNQFNSESEVKSALKNLSDTNFLRMFDTYISEKKGYNLNLPINLNEGGLFESNITDLYRGTVYYIKSFANNSSHQINSSIYKFMTRPGKPYNVKTNFNGDSVKLDWNKGVASQKTIIERNPNGKTIWERGEGVEIYNGPLTSFIDEDGSIDSSYQLWGYSLNTNYKNILFENFESDENNDSIPDDWVYDGNKSRESENYLVNPSFEDGMDGWVIGEGGEDGTPKISSSESYSGDNSIHFISRNSSGCNINLSGSEYLPVLSGKMYEWSGCAKADNIITGDQGWHKLIGLGKFYNSSYGRPPGNAYNFDFNFDNGTYDWKCFSGRAMSPEDSKYYRLYRIGIYSTGVGEAWLDNLSFHRYIPPRYDCSSEFSVGYKPNSDLDKCAISVIGNESWNSKYIDIEGGREYILSLVIKSLNIGIEKPTVKTYWYDENYNLLNTKVRLLDNITNEYIQHSLSYNSSENAQYVKISLSGGKEEIDYFWYDTIIFMEKDEMSQDSFHVSITNSENIILDILNITETTALIKGNLIDVSGNDISVWLEYSDVDPTNNGLDISYYPNFEISPLINSFDDIYNHEYYDDNLECTGFIATGNVVKDRRSILWKSRHSDEINNTITYLSGNPFSYFGVVNNENLTLVSWGMNEAGLLVSNYVASSPQMSEHNRHFTSTNNSIGGMTITGYVLENFDNVEDAAKHIAQNSWLYNHGHGHNHAIISAETGKGAIVSTYNIQGQTYGHISWINNTWTAIDNSLYCETNGTKKLDGQEINRIALDIINNGGLNNDSLFDWKEIIQRMGKSAFTREQSIGYFNLTDTQNTNRAVSAIIGLSGNEEFEGVANIAWITLGRNPLVNIFFPIGASYIKSMDDLPIQLITGFEDYTKEKVGYVSDGGDLGVNLYNAEKVREIQSYTNYAEDISFVEYDKFIERLNTNQFNSESEVKSALKNLSDTNFQRMFDTYVSEKKGYNITIPVTIDENKLFETNITDLYLGTVYYIKSFVDNSSHQINSSVYKFMTRPGKPYNIKINFTENSVIINWSKGVASQKTIIERNSNGKTIWERGEGVEIYNGPLISFIDEDGSIDSSYQLWGYMEKDEMSQDSFHVSIINEHSIGPSGGSSGGGGGSRIIEEEIVIEECKERWVCGDWMPLVCPSSEIQTRNCEEVNDCGTQIQKPSTSKTCKYHAPIEEEPIGEPVQELYSPVVEDTSYLWIYIIVLVILCVCGGTGIILYELEHRAREQNRFFDNLFKLQNYIIEKIKLGYNEIQIKQYLLSNNYDLKIIDQAFSLIKLQDYINFNLAKGYTSEQLKSAILRLGWKEDIVDYIFRKLEK
jgi:uncharacterized protein (DUF2132 family)